jgi:hypothetical protein
VQVVHNVVQEVFYAGASVFHRICNTCVRCVLVLCQWYVWVVLRYVLVVG